MREMTDKKLTEEENQSSEAVLKSAANPWLKSEVLSIKVEILLNQWSEKRDNDLKIMTDFEERLKKCCEKTIRAFNREFRKTYVEEEVVNEKLKKLENTLKDIEKVETLFARMDNSFAAMRAQLFPSYVSPTQLSEDKSSE